MSYIKLAFPVLVQNIPYKGQLQYQLRPLFVSNPIVIGRRFEPSINQFRANLTTQLKGFELTRANAESLLWYLFNPEINFYTQSLSFQVGRQFFDGKINVAEFEWKGMTFICLPALEHFIFLAKTSSEDKVSISTLITKNVAAKLKQWRQERQQDLDFDAYYATKGAFITTITQNIRIKQASFRFERQEASFFFDYFSADTNFDGGIEIEKVGKDLLQNYPSHLLRAFHQEALVESLFSTLFQSENIPLVIVGKEGIGKHSLLHEVIYRYRKRNIKTNIEKLCSVWHIDPTRIIAGMSVVGWWQKRFEAILNFAQTRQKEFSKNPLPDKIVFDNIVSLHRIGKSAQNNMTLSDVLKPYLEKRKLSVVLIATPEEWKIVQEKDRSFADLFQVLRIPTVTTEKAVDIVLTQRRSLELEYACVITIQAIQALFSIQRNYLKHKALPGSVMKLLRQLVIKHKFGYIDLPEVRADLRNFSGLKESIFDSAYTIERDDVRKKITANLVGQPEAVDALANVIHTIKAKLNTPNKPLGSFLFIGPTGVGKTQAAKVLCKYLMGDEKHLMRFDMNEYIDEGATHRLIGDYYNPEGQLTGKVRYNPFGILLLDEIEKAHPKVHDLLLQVLDDGRLTDSIGRTVDFSNIIIIMTSNVGAKEVANQLGFGQGLGNDAAIYQKAVTDRFRPEFINRIGRIVIFSPLSLKHILNIARLQIKELLQRDGFVRRSTILNISQEALEWVAKRGYDARMGGRALKRQIERDLTILSAEQLITTTSEQPILFDIFYDGEKLIPKINPLEFVAEIEGAWLPKTPSEKEGRHFYGKLLRKVEQIEQKISYLESVEQQEELIIVGNNKGEQLNWQHYDFKNKVAEVKERISTLLLGYRDRNFDEAPALPLRLKRIKINSANFSKNAPGRVYKKRMKDQLFQQEGLQEITEYYQHAATQFDSLSTEFIDNYLNVSFLEVAIADFLKKKIEKISLQLETATTGLGTDQIKYLLAHYSKVFDFLDIRYTKNEATNTLIAEGYSLYRLLVGEIGIHLFYTLQQNMIPIKLTILRESMPSVHQSKLQIIRVYNQKTLTDVRTGFSNTIAITPQEFKLLLYAGMN